MKSKQSKTYIRGDYRPCWFKLADGRKVRGQAAFLPLQKVYDFMALIVDVPPDLVEKLPEDSAFLTAHLDGADLEFPQ